MADESPETRAQGQPVGVDASGAAEPQSHQAGLVVQGHSGLIGRAHRTFHAGMRIGFGGHFAARICSSAVAD